jgi:hypothetical protein
MMRDRRPSDSRWVAPVLTHHPARRELWTSATRHAKRTCRPLAASQPATCRGPGCVERSYVFLIALRLALFACGQNFEHGATCGRPACSMWSTWGRRSLSRASCSVRSDVADWFPGICNSLRLGAGLRDFGHLRQDQFPQVQAPQPQPPLDAVGAGSVFAPAAVANENRRRTRSLPQFGHATSTWTVEPIGRRSSNGRSQLRQMYS